MELQIWEYLDGSSTTEERVRIERAIATDEEWKSKYDEIIRFHESLSGQLELEQTSMRFSKNVMDFVATMPLAKPMRAYIDKKVVYLVAALFGVVFLVLLFAGLDSASSGGAAGDLINSLSNRLPSMKISVHGGSSLLLTAVYAVLLVLLADRVLHFMGKSDNEITV